MNREALGIKAIGGVECLSPDAMALLLGITEEELVAECQRQQAEHSGKNAMVLPKEWLRQGKELVASLGVDTVEEALTILRSKKP